MRLEQEIEYLAALWLWIVDQQARRSACAGRTDTVEAQATVMAIERDGVRSLPRRLRHSWQQTKSGGQRKCRAHLHVVTSKPQRPPAHNPLLLASAQLAESCHERKVSHRYAF